jgi:hypothetical protein
MDMWWVAASGSVVCGTTLHVEIHSSPRGLHTELYLLALLYILCVCAQDLVDAVWNIKSIPQWASWVLTTVFVCSNVGTSLLVTDLGQVLHMIGGTVAR